MPPSKNTAPASYEAALEELELLIGRVESGQLPLDEMQAAYQRSEMLMAFCRQRRQTRSGLTGKGFVRGPVWRARSRRWVRSR